MGSVYRLSPDHLDVHAYARGYGWLRDQGMTEADLTPQHYPSPINGLMNFGIPPDPYKDETDEQRADRKLRQVQEAIEREWVTMPPSVLPDGWKPLGRWEMFKLNFGLMLMRFGEVR